MSLRKTYKLQVKEGKLRENVLTTPNSSDNNNIIINISKDENFSEF